MYRKMDVPDRDSASKSGTDRTRNFHDFSGPRIKKSDHFEGEYDTKYNMFLVLSKIQKVGLNVLLRVSIDILYIFRSKK